MIFHSFVSFLLWSSFLVKANAGPGTVFVTQSTKLSDTVRLRTSFMFSTCNPLGRVPVIVGFSFASWKDTCSSKKTITDLPDLFTKLLSTLKACTASSCTDVSVQMPNITCDGQSKMISPDAVDTQFTCDSSWQEPGLKIGPSVPSTILPGSTTLTTFKTQMTTASTASTTSTTSTTTTTSATSSASTQLTTLFKLVQSAESSSFASTMTSKATLLTNQPSPTPTEVTKPTAATIQPAAVTILTTAAGISEDSSAVTPPTTAPHSVGTAQAITATRALADVLFTADSKTAAPPAETAVVFSVLPTTVQLSTTADPKMFITDEKDGVTVRNQHSSSYSTAGAQLPAHSDSPVQQDTFASGKMEDTSQSSGYTRQILIHAKDADWVAMNTAEFICKSLDSVTVIEAHNLISEDDICPAKPVATEVKRLFEQRKESVLMIPRIQCDKAHNISSIMIYYTCAEDQLAYSSSTGVADELPQRDSVRANVQAGSLTRPNSLSGVVLSLFICLLWPK